jgi:hypothetical protein
MLSIFFIKFDFHRFCQSGCYFDFFYKKLSEVFVRNFFVYSSQFLGEKYMIEYLTKNIFNKSVFYFNKVIGSNNLQYFDFFYNILMNLFYIVIFICIFTLCI